MELSVCFMFAIRTITLASRLISTDLGAVPSSDTRPVCFSERLLTQPVSDQPNPHLTLCIGFQL